MPLDGLLTTQEIAQKTGLAVRTIQAHIRRGNLRAQKIGRDFFVEVADFEEWVTRNKRGRPPKKHSPEGR